MTELNSNEEPHVLPSKRNHTTETLESDDSTKKLRSDSSAVDEENISIKNGEHDVINDEIEEKIEEEEEEESEEYEGEEETDSDDENDDEDGDEVDRKGKGIMKDDYKGKGKMIEEEEEEDDDSDDSDGGDSESDGDDDDLSDDPLMEVDLDNILPSRTRRRTAASSGVHISGDDGKNKDA